MDIGDLLLVHRHASLLDGSSPLRAVRDKFRRHQCADQINLRIPEGRRIELHGFQMLRIRSACGKQLPRALLGMLCLLLAVNHLRQLICKDFLDRVQLLSFLLCILIDLLKRNEGEELHALDDIGIADIPPVLIEVIRGGLVRIEPDCPLRRLAHLLAFRIRQKRDGHRLGVIPSQLAADQLAAGQHVRPLVIAAELHLAAEPLVQLVEIVRLHDHVVKLKEGQPLLPSLLVALRAQHLVDREAGSDLTQQVHIVQIQQPVCVVDNPGLPLSELNEPRHLLLEAVAVVLDDLRRHHRSGIGPSGRITDHAGSASKQGDRFVPRHLQSLHQAQRHKMPDMQAVRSRVEPDVERRLAGIDHVSDPVRIRELREQSAGLKFLIYTHQNILSRLPRKECTEQASTGSFSSGIRQNSRELHKV